LLQFDVAVSVSYVLLILLGQMPPPPYIKDSVYSFEQYQTVYALKQSGAIVLQQLGYTFTPELLQPIAGKRGLRL